MVKLLEVKISPQTLITESGEAIATYRIKTEAEFTRICKEILQGFAWMHKKKILHCKINLDCVYMFQYNGEGIVKIGDLHDCRSYKNDDEIFNDVHIYYKTEEITNYVR